MIPLHVDADLAVPPTDDEAMDRRDEARQAAWDADRCGVCGNPSSRPQPRYPFGLTDGVCDECWDEEERAYERRCDQ